MLPISYISPMYHQNQGHILVIWTWEKKEKNLDSPLPSFQKSQHFEWPSWTFSKILHIILGWLPLVWQRYEILNIKSITHSDKQTRETNETNIIRHKERRFLYVSKFSGLHICPQNHTFPTKLHLSSKYGRFFEQNGLFVDWSEEFWL